LSGNPIKNWRRKKRGEAIGFGTVKKRPMSAIIQAGGLAFEKSCAEKGKKQTDAAPL